MASVKRNFLYSSILTSANYVFPLIVYPYVSRVLGVTNIGLCNFVDSIINYFILFSMLGITTIGIREIASNQGDKEKQSRVFSSLLTLNFITTVISITVLIIATCLVDKLRENWDLMIVGGLKLFFNLFLIEWFYKGIENFKYITIRSIIVRTIYVITVFIFVKSREDVLFYYAATCLTIALNSLFNILYSRKFVCFSIKGLTFRPFIASFFILGLYSLLTSMYTTFNVAFLGFTCDDDQVGYYATATKLYTILLSIYTAFTGVMMPRMSNLIATGQIDEFRRKLTMSLDILIRFSIPIIIFVMVCAPDLIWLLSGAGYEGAILPMRIIIPLILIIGYEQVLVMQTLMPCHADKVIFINSCVGAAVGVVMNIALVGKLGAVGSSIVWVLAECVILILSQIAVKKEIGLKFQALKILKTVVLFIPLFIFICVVNHYLRSPFIALSVCALISGVYFMVANLKFIRDLINKRRLKNTIE